MKNMPIYSVYAKIRKSGRHTHQIRNTVVHSFTEQPLDYFDLKSYLLDAARKIYYDHDQQTTTQISIEKHLGGRYIRAMMNYRESHIHFRRQLELKAKLTYNPQQDKVKVENANFITPEFYQFKDDYDRERGRKWKLKPVVEAGFEATMLNPESIFFNLLAIKNSTYEQDPRGIYSSTQERQHTTSSYDRQVQGTYGPANENTVERDKQEKENEY